MEEAALSVGNNRVTKRRVQVSEGHRGNQAKAFGVLGRERMAHGMDGLAELLEPVLHNFKIVVMRFQAAFVEEERVTPEDDDHHFLGEALRGGLGWQLRARCCGLKQRGRLPSCSEQCPEASGCSYRKLFQPVHPPGVFDHHPLKGLESGKVPRPFALRFDPLPAGRVISGQVFNFEITLIGSGTQEAGAVCLAVHDLQDAGIGKKKLRSRFHLISITQVFPWVDHLLWVCGNDGPITLPEPVPLKLWAPGGTSPQGRLEVAWTKSPLCLMEEERVPGSTGDHPQGGKRGLVGSIRELSANLVMMNAFHRLWRLSSLYCPGPCGPHKDKASEVLRREHRIAMVPAGSPVPYSETRPSRQEDNIQPLRGIMATVVFEGEVASLHYLLALTHPLGIGQKTTYGFGRYELHLTPS